MRSSPMGGFTVQPGANEPLLPPDIALSSTEVYIANVLAKSVSISIMFAEFFSLSLCHFPLCLLYKV